MKATSIRVMLACLAVSTSAVVAAPLDPNAARPITTDAGPFKTIPLEGWAVDSKSFIGSMKQSRLGTAKAATDLATVYRPLPICRLIDTRGFAAAIAVAGPLAPNSTTNINSAGFCGIPNNGEVAGISLSFHVFNNTVNNGGYIVFQQQGAAITGVNAVFNPGAQWTAATANVSIPNGSGNFSIFIANSQVQVIVDVNGYYQNLDDLDVGTQQFDIVGNTTGDLFELTNSATGSALTLDNFSNGPAITINAGKFRVAGADTANTSGPGPVLTHTVNTAAFGSGGTICGGFPAFTIIDHPFSNGNANAVLFVTANDSTGGTQPSAGPFELYYILGTSCTPAIGTARWAIRDHGNAAHVNGSKFNVMIITP